MLHIISFGMQLIKFGIVIKIEIFFSFSPNSNIWTDINISPLGTVKVNLIEN